MHLLWDNEQELGYYPVNPADYPYNENYFEKYRGYAHTARGKLITQHRAELAMAFATKADTIVDIGCGAGSFIEFMDAHEYSVYGTDINPWGQDWLAARGKRWMKHRPSDVLTFFDSLEHLPRPDLIVAQARKTVILSIPIFEDKAHALRSKHFRPDEHYWYFTASGLEKFMKELGFKLAYANSRESDLGREDIWSFVFNRQLDEQIAAQ